MKLKNVVHTVIDHGKHLVSVEGQTRNIGGFGETEEEATKDFLEKAEKVRAMLGAEDFLAQFPVETPEETAKREDAVTEKTSSPGIVPKSQEEAGLLNANAKLQAPIATSNTATTSGAVNGVKPDGNMSGLKGLDSNALTGEKPSTN